MTTKEGDDDDNDLFEGQDLQDFPTGNYAIPENLMDPGARNAMDGFSDIDHEAEVVRALMMGRLAIVNRNMDEAMRNFKDAAGWGSEEGRFFVGWLNVNTLVKVKGVEMSDNARATMFENLIYMVGAIWEYQKPQLIFKLYETLQVVLNYDCLEVFSSDGGDLNWNRMLELMQRCMEADENNAVDAFSRLLSFLNEFTSSAQFMEAENKWVDR